MADENKSPDPTELPPGYRVPDADADLLQECRIETFRAGGKGGQHQNTTDSAVRIVHLPSGIVVTARERRSQHRNRQQATERLRAALWRRLSTPEPRVGTKVPKAQKRKRLENKRAQSRTKRLRKPPRLDD